MLYARTDMSYYDKYAFKITSLSSNIPSSYKNIVGIIKDDTLSFELSHNLKDVGGGGFLGNLTDKAIERIGGQKVLQMFTGQDSLSEMTEMYTLQMPKSFGSPDLSFTAVMYENMKVKGVSIPSYTNWMKTASTWMLPKRNDISGVGATLTSNQTDMTDYVKILGLQGVAQSKAETSVGASVEIGNLFSSAYGWWVTSIGTSTHISLDQYGIPVIWEVSISLSYFKQIDYEKFSEFFI